MFEDFSAICETLKAKLKNIKKIMKAGLIIGNELEFDTAFGVMSLCVYDSIVPNNKRIQLTLKGRTYMGDSIIKVFEQI